MSEPIKQHYVPQTYLRNFSSSKNIPYQTFVLDKRKNNIFLANIKNIASERHFYTLKNHQDKFRWENYYAEKIEPLTKDVVSQILSQSNSILLNDKATVLTPELKARLSFAIYFQLLRGKHTRDIGERTSYYVEQIDRLGDMIKDTTLSYSENKRIHSQIKYFQVLLQRTRGGVRQSSGYLINYLSNKGVLPSYSFPLHTVELLLPKDVKDSEHLSLERDLRQAITEYAPGSEIVADKRIWKSKQPLFWQDTPPVHEYRICEHCHHLDMGKDAGVPIESNSGTCSVCGRIQGNKSRIRSFVEPDGFIADENSGKAAKQYVNIEKNQTRSALIPESNLKEEELSEFVHLAYNQKGELLYVNEGKYGYGFKFPLKAFAFMTDKEERANQLSMGHIQTTNTLHIRFSGNAQVRVPSPEDHTFWYSLLYALLHGASRCLQIDRHDLDGVLFPRSNGGAWEQTIVLYDNVSGGAGHVKNIKENFELVLNEARRVLNCSDCAPDTSCYHCLRDYNNQYHHEYLKRDTPLEFLDLLIASQEPIDSGVPGTVRVNASVPDIWLNEKIRYSKQSLILAISNLTSGHPLGENFTWLDTLGDLVNKGCAVDLYLQDLPNQTAEDYSLATHLQVLMDKGLKLWQIKQIPKWQIVIDRQSQNRRIICSEDGNDEIILDDSIGTKRLLTSTDSEAVKEVYEEWNSMGKRVVYSDDLNPPPTVEVINIKASSRPTSEQEIFSKVFEEPCVKMIVHDPYLYNEEKIVNRLGNYIALAEAGGHLKEVIVHTKKNHEEQEVAKSKLEKMFDCTITFKYSVEHDRYIDITRLSGEKARIFIGRGLDFIRPDGSTKSTYIVIQDPIS